MKQLVLFTSLLYMTVPSLCAPSEVAQKNSNTTYDQRQVGKYNIHVNIKDVSIIALSPEDIVDHIGDSDSYADYYDYEDSEYTVDPVTADLSGRPTKKPNVTSSLQPSIAGLNLSSISASTDQHTQASTPQTIVVIHEKPSHENETKDSIKTESSSVSYQPDEIPVQVIVEPLLKTKPRPPQSMKRKVSNRQVGGVVDEELLTRPRPRRAQMLERMRARRAQNKMARNGNGCGRRAISDGHGGCRVRRSGMSGFLDFLAKFLPKGDSV